jgi:thymidylate synthase
MWNQRSVDSFLGLPFNIASYGLLLHIIAKLTNKIPHELIGNLGDCHIYKNHIDSVREQIKRTPHKLPTLKLPEVHCADLNSYLEQVKTSDFILENYEHEPKIVYPMAI